MLNTSESFEWQHTSLVVDDVDVALKFYAGSFGYEATLDVREMGELIQSMLGLDDVTCDLIQAKSAISDHVLEVIAFHNVPADANRRLPIWPGHSHVAFTVRDLNNAIASVTERGAVQIGKVTEFSNGPAVYCWDPAGTVFELDQPVGRS